MQMNKEKIESKLKEKTQMLNEGCWLWQGNINAYGYGRIGIDNEIYLVHRLSANLYLNYDLTDEKHDVLHKPWCPRKNCWNPKHLYVGTHQQNMQDKIIEGNANNQNTFKTHCKNGHEFTPENTYNTNRGKRLCKICENIRSKRDYERRNKNSLSILPK